MTRHLGIASGAIVMAAHAYIVGGVIDSAFFLVALPWVMVAIWAFQGDLRAIPSMAWVMVLLLTASLFVSLVTTPPSKGALSVLSLSIVPSIISWLGLILYLRHLSRVELTDTLDDLQEEYEIENRYWDEVVEARISAGGSTAFGETLLSWSGQSSEHGKSGVSLGRLPIGSEDLFQDSLDSHPKAA